MLTACGMSFIQQSLGCLLHEHLANMPRRAVLCRAMVELHLALEENSICRCPLLAGHQTHDELTGLYKLHIQNTEVPPNFAVLLQLRELLGLAADESEELESQVLHEAQAFSI
jgi:hypothetical protein